MTDLSGEELRISVLVEVLGYQRWSLRKRPDRWFLATRQGVLDHWGNDYAVLAGSEAEPYADALRDTLDVLTWEGMRQLIERFWSVSLEKCDGVDPPWHACVWNRQDTDPCAEGRGNDAPEAVARACLAAKRVEHAMGGAAGAGGAG